MTNEISIERLLRWRLALAAADAPPPPRAALLLQLARPWWEVWPHRMRARLEQLRRMPAALGYAMAAVPPAGRGHPVATILALGEDVEAYAQVHYFSVRDGQLRFRFMLDHPAATQTEQFEATFIADGDMPSPFAAPAHRAPNGEFRLDVELPDELASAWGTLRVTDPMPFRLILCPSPEQP
jgi:hypothetical protein